MLLPDTYAATVQSAQLLRFRRSAGECGIWKRSLYFMSIPGEPSPRRQLPSGGKEISEEFLKFFLGDPVHLSGKCLIAEKKVLPSLTQGSGSSIFSPGVTLHYQKGKLSLAVMNHGPGFAVGNPGPLTGLPHTAERLDLPKQGHHAGAEDGLLPRDSKAKLRADEACLALSLQLLEIAPMADMDQDSLILDRYPLNERIRERPACVPKPAPSMIGKDLLHCLRREKDRMSRPPPKARENQTSLPLHHALQCLRLKERNRQRAEKNSRAALPEVAKPLSHILEKTGPRPRKKDKAAEFKAIREFLSLFSSQENKIPDPCAAKAHDNPLQIAKTLILSPLLQPKTTSARRFLTDSKGRTPTDEKGAPLARGEHFASGQFLGAAAYPVHRTIVERKGLDDSGFPKRAQDDAVLAGQKQDNIGVRLTARSWVKIGSRLRCRVSFSNLSGDELTALIWVLTPKNLVPPRERNDDPRTVGFLQMGLGKPLGLGALEVRIAEGGLHVISGKDLGAAYEDLSGCLGESESQTEVSEYSFAEDVRAELERQPWVQALQRAAFGYTDGKEVRYMSLDENKTNNQTDFKTGRPKDHRGFSPRDLHGNDSHRCTQIPSDKK